MQNMSALSSPSCPQEETEPASFWTPGCSSTYSNDSDTEEDEQHKATTVTKFNEVMKTLSELSGMEKPPELSSQLNDLELATVMEKNECVDVATKACKLICSIVAPNDGEKLFDSLPRENNAQHLLPLVTAYAQAPSRNLKTQMLSIYVYELPKKVLYTNRTANLLNGKLTGHVLMLEHVDQVTR